MSKALALDDVSVSYGANKVFSSVSLSLYEGELGCLLGASGSGKSTLLRAIAGFESLDAGTINLAGKVVSGPATSVPAHLRGVGMVFQDHALFPHLTVAQNITFGLQKSSSNKRKARVAELLGLIGLADRAADYPHQLSGGQQQRVALARALAPRPKLILLDEPFASLDSQLRRQLSIDVRAILKQTQTTALLVTHDQQEAFVMADKVGLLSGGALQQWDTPYRMYHNPVSRIVARFIGEGVFLPATVDDKTCVTTSLGHFCSVQGPDLVAEKPTEVLIRPDDILFDEASDIRAVVIDRQFRGAEFLYKLELRDGSEVLASFPSHLDYPIGNDIGIRVELDHVITFQ